MRPMFKGFTWTGLCGWLDTLLSAYVVFGAPVVAHRGERLVSLFILLTLLPGCVMGAVTAFSASRQLRPLRGLRNWLYFSAGFHLLLAIAGTGVDGGLWFWLFLVMAWIFYVAASREHRSQPPLPA